MPRDISPSSSENEDDTEQPMETNTKKMTSYQCPADFVSFCHRPSSSTLKKSLQGKNKELWLIKAPASFKPECFRGVKVPLSGLKTLKVPSAAAGAKTESSQHIYNIMGSSHGIADLCLLTRDKQSSSKVLFGPKFSGLLNVCESFGDSITNQAPLVIPAAPAPSIPEGLKQRFHPFGSKTPMVSLGSEEGSRKRKKKKEKRIKVEQEYVMSRVKAEPVWDLDGAVAQQQPQEGGVVEEEKKKKKKKKKRDREQQGSEPRMDPEVAVKCEPMDSQNGDVVEGCGKKKKKKKSKTDDN